jgi:hypothetical protein
MGAQKGIMKDFLSVKDEWDKLKLPEGKSNTGSFVGAVKARHLLLSVDDIYCRERENFLTFMKLHQKLTWEENKQHFNNEQEGSYTAIAEEYLAIAFVRFFSQMWGVNIHTNEASQGFPSFGNAKVSYSFHPITHLSAREEFGDENIIIIENMDRFSEENIRDHWTDSKHEILIKINVEKNIEQIKMDVEKIYNRHKSLGDKKGRLHDDEFAKIEFIQKENYKRFFKNTSKTRCFNFSPRENWLEIYKHVVDKQSGRDGYSLSDYQFCKDRKIDAKIVRDVRKKVPPAILFFQGKRDIDEIKKYELGRLLVDVIKSTRMLSEEELKKMRSDWLKSYRNIKK